jgi:sirohydrochlorin cobaltochelatase
MTTADAVLDSRLKTLLPTEYQETYDTIEPKPMGSAGLKYDADGQVAWDQIWGSFCDLAMAGGPPHKGALLEPGTAAEIDAEPVRYRDVVEEICRGVTMVTDLPAKPSPVAGWVRVDSYSQGMAAWLLRAITMENVAVRTEGRAVDLPAAPAFRVEKEIKNVITVIAKTCHYWMGHMPRAQRVAIGQLFTSIEAESPLVEPATAREGTRGTDDRPASVLLGQRIQLETGLSSSPHRYAGWLGVECSSVRAAVWMMRAMVVSNVLARREGTVLFVPVDPENDPGGRRVSQFLARIHRLAAVRGVL